MSVAVNGEKAVLVARTTISLNGAACGAATSDNTETIVVTGGDLPDNVLVGSTAANTLTGGAGDDEIDDGAGNDVLRGGDGADILVGDTGRLLPRRRRQRHLLQRGRRGRDGGLRDRDSGRPRAVGHRHVLELRAHLSSAEQAPMASAIRSPRVMKLAAL